MQALNDRLREARRHLGKGMVRVSDFLNHQVDSQLLAACGEALANRWRDVGVSRVLTAETSGIAPALVTALALNVPLVYARKRRIATLGPDVYSASAPSPTHGGTYDLVVAAPFIKSGDRVLIIDDILASGHTITALAQIINQADAQLVGIGAIVEKRYSGGREVLAELGVPIEALAVILTADDKGLVLEESADSGLGKPDPSNI